MTSSELKDFALYEGARFFEVTVISGLKHQDKEVRGGDYAIIKKVKGKMAIVLHKKDVEDVQGCWYYNHFADNFMLIIFVDKNILQVKTHGVDIIGQGRRHYDYMTFAYEIEPNYANFLKIKRA